MRISSTTVRFGTIVFAVKPKQKEGKVPVFRLQVWRDRSPGRVVLRSRVPGNSDIVVLNNSPAAKALTKACKGGLPKIDPQAVYVAVNGMHEDLFNPQSSEDRRKFNPEVAKRLPQEGLKQHLYGSEPVGGKRREPIHQKVRTSLIWAARILGEHGVAGLVATQETVGGKKITVYRMKVPKTDAPQPKPNQPET